MILNSARTKMVQENVAVPGPADGRLDARDDGHRRGRHQRLLRPRRAALGVRRSRASSRPTRSCGDFTGETLLPQTAGCRPLASFQLQPGVFDKLAKIVGLDLGGPRAFANLTTGEVAATFGPDKFNPNSAVFRIPRVFLFDDERGGRVQGIVDLELPRPFTFKQQGNNLSSGARTTSIEVPVRVGVGVEVSAAEGVKPTSLGIDIPRDIPLPIPGVRIRDLLAVIDPTNNRFGGGARLVLPGNKAFGGEFVLNDGRIERIGIDIGFPTPGRADLRPARAVPQLGRRHVRRRHARRRARPGRQQVTPFSIQGRMKALVGPSIAGQGAFAHGRLADRSRAEDQARHADHRARRTRSSSPTRRSRSAWTRSASRPTATSTSRRA